MDRSRVIPVTVKMLIEAGSSRESRLAYLLTPWTTVRLVGRALGFKTNSVAAEFTLDDGTGHVQVNYWFIEQGVCPPAIRGMSNGTYVDVVGRARLNAECVLVQAFSSRRILDFNMITHHFLHTIHAYVDITRGAVVTPISPSDYAPTYELSNVVTGETSARVHDNAVGGHYGHVVVTTVCNDVINDRKDNKENGGGGVTVIEDHETQDNHVEPVVEYDETKQLRANALEFIRAHQSESGLSGVSVSVLVERFDVEEGYLRGVLKELESVGEIYQTVDADHFSAT